MVSASSPPYVGAYNLWRFHAGHEISAFIRPTALPANPAGKTF